MKTATAEFTPTADDDARTARIVAALKRARLRAEEIARATGTQLVQYENGQIVYVDPPKVVPSDKTAAK
jgi:hypothetical protein